MANKNGNEYQLINRITGGNTVEYKVVNVNTRVVTTLSAEQFAFMVGKGWVTNCTGYIHGDKVIYRGKGIKLSECTDTVSVIAAYKMVLVKISSNLNIQMSYNEDDIYMDSNGNVIEISSIGQFRDKKGFVYEVQVTLTRDKIHFSVYTNQNIALSNLCRTGDATGVGIEDTYKSFYKAMSTFLQANRI